MAPEAAWARRAWERVSECERSDGSGDQGERLRGVVKPARAPTCWMRESAPARPTRRRRATVASSGRRWAEPRRAGPPVVGRTRVRPPAALVATPTPRWSLPQPVRAMLAPGCSVLRCSSCGRHPCLRLSPNNFDPQKPWPREASPAQVRLPRARRGSCACPRTEALGAADRLCRSVSTSWCQDVEPRLRALRLCRRRLFLAR